MLKEMFEQLIFGNRWETKKFLDGAYIYENSIYRVMVRINSSLPYAFSTMEDFVHYNLVEITSISLIKLARLV